MGKRVVNLEAWLLERCYVDAETGCWNYLGPKGGHGSNLKIDGLALGAPQIAAMVYLGHRPNGTMQVCVCHHCDNPLCCRPDHLFLGTQAENLGDMVAKGRSRGGGPCGEAHGRAKLTDAEVAKIRALSGTMFQREIGARFGVSQSHVSYITLGKGR